jgi:hypothetical protein
MSTNTTYYVYSKISGDQFAACNFYLDKAGTDRLFSPLPATVGNVVFEDTADSPLTLVGAVFKTDGSKPPLTSNNYVAATNGQVSIPLSENQSRGVILIFAYVNSAGEILMLFPSSDPQIVNSEE